MGVGCPVSARPAPRNFSFARGRHGSGRNDVAGHVVVVQRGGVPFDVKVFQSSSAWSPTGPHHRAHAHDQKRTMFKHRHRRKYHHTSKTENKYLARSVPAAPPAAPLLPASAERIAALTPPPPPPLPAGPQHARVAAAGASGAIACPRCVCRERYRCAQQARGARAAATLWPPCMLNGARGAQAPAAPAPQSPPTPASPETAARARSRPPAPHVQAALIRAHRKQYARTRADTHRGMHTRTRARARARVHTHNAHTQTHTHTHTQCTHTHTRARTVSLIAALCRSELRSPPAPPHWRGSLLAFPKTLPRTCAVLPLPLSL